MAIGSEIRKSDMYTGDGVQTKFTFAFKLLAAADAEVRVAPEDGTEEVLAKSAYTCSLNEDQDNNPGGFVTLAEPLAQGATLVVISAEEALQPAVFTNRGAFYPTVLNDSLDRLTILVQQLKENVSRAITTSPTDTMSASELKQKLLDAAQSAFDVATQQAEAARKSAEEAKAVEERVVTKESDIIADIVAEGDKQDARLIAEGDKQIDRIQMEADNELIANGVGGGEKFWTLSADVAAGTEITIPGGLQYIVNRHHLRVSWNGLVLFIGQNFTEVGAEDEKSGIFKLTFDVKEGDELDVWIGALGKGNVDEAISLAGEASAAVAELSRKVVYKEET